MIYTVCFFLQTRAKLLLYCINIMKQTQKSKEKTLEEIKAQMREHWDSEEFQESKKSHTRSLSED